MKLAGVLTTLNSIGALIDHVLVRRMPSLLQALRLKSKRIGTLKHHNPLYAPAVAANLEEMAKMRDNMPPLPTWLRMVHYGYMDCPEPADDNARIEARVLDFSAFVGERSVGYWAQEGALPVAPLAPSS